MKKLARNIAIIFLMMTNANALAANNVKTYRCPLTTNELSQAFANAWVKTDHDTYFSYIHLNSEGTLFSGALHTKATELADVNPHLTYAHLHYEFVAERLAWHLECLYEIRNSNMVDMDDGFLHMTTSITDTRSCWQMNINTIKCA